MSKVRGITLEVVVQGEVPAAQTELVRILAEALSGYDLDARTEDGWTMFLVHFAHEAEANLFRTVLQELPDAPE